jgi:predicted MFS family arabinose efflux permease
MSGFAIAGVVGSLVAAATPSTWPRSAAIAAALIVLWAGLCALYAPPSLGWYFVGCAIGGFYWNFVLPLMLGLLARIDLTGQGAVLGGTMSSMGAALGPLVAGHLVHDADYRPVGWMTGSLCLASLVLVWLVERRSKRAYASVPAGARDLTAPAE